MPIFHVAGSGIPVNISFRGASGEGNAIIESDDKIVRISAEFGHLGPPTSYGSDYLAYVLWAISSNHPPLNLGELSHDGDRMKIRAACQFTSFGLVVTAESNSAVEQPMGTIVLENVIPSGLDWVPGHYWLPESGGDQGSTTVQFLHARRKELDEKGTAALSREKAAVVADAARKGAQEIEREHAEAEAYSAGRIFRPPYSSCHATSPSRPCSLTALISPASVSGSTGEAGTGSASRGRTC